MIAKEPQIDTVWDFLATLYAAQEKIGTNELWNRELVDGLKAFSKNSAVQGVIAEKIHSFQRADVGKAWAEYQVLLNDIHAMIDSAQYALPGYEYRAVEAGLMKAADPTEIVASDNTVIATGITIPADYADARNTLLIPYEAGLGTGVTIFDKVDGGNGQRWDYITELRASDGTLIADNLTTPQMWADTWNNLLIPYEKSIGVDVQYITPLLGVNSQNFYRKSTLPNPYTVGIFS